MRELNQKQKRFADEYLIDLNATQAATRAGYSAKTANEQGARLLAHVSVQAYLSARMKMRESRTEITQDKVLREIARVAFSDPRKVMTWGTQGVQLRDSEELTDDEAAIISEVSSTASDHGINLKLKTHDKLKALELLGRHLSMFKDNLSIDLSKLTDEQLAAVASGKSPS